MRGGERCSTCSYKPQRIDPSKSRGMCFFYLNENTILLEFFFISLTSLQDLSFLHPNLTSYQGYIGLKKKKKKKTDLISTNYIPSLYLQQVILTLSFQIHVTGQWRIHMADCHTLILCLIFLYAYQADFLFKEVCWKHFLIDRKQFSLPVAIQHCKGSQLAFSVVLTEKSGKGCSSTGESQQPGRDLGFLCW